MPRDIEYAFWFDPETNEPRSTEFDDDIEAFCVEASLEDLGRQHDLWNYSLLTNDWYKYTPDKNGIDSLMMSVKHEEVPAVFRAMLLLLLP